MEWTVKIMFSLNVSVCLSVCLPVTWQSLAEACPAQLKSLSAPLAAKYNSNLQTSFLEGTLSPLAERKWWTYIMICISTVMLNVGFSHLSGLFNNGIMWRRDIAAVTAADSGGDWHCRQMWQWRINRQRRCDTRCWNDTTRDGDISRWHTGPHTDNTHQVITRPKTPTLWGQIFHFKSQLHRKHWIRTKTTCRRNFQHWAWIFNSVSFDPVGGHQILVTPSKRVISATVN